MSIFDRITSLADQGSGTGILKLDFNKAFDQVNHDVLQNLTKYEQHGNTVRRAYSCWRSAPKKDM